MSSVVAPGDRALESRHRSPEIDILGPENQVVVVPHEAPAEDRPSIEIAHVSKCLDELDCFAMVVEYELATRDSAIHVIDRPGKEQAGMSRHEISPMRGWDNPSLLSPTQPQQVWKCVRGTHAAERLEIAKEMIEQVQAETINPENRPDAFEDDLLIFSVDLISREQSNWRKGKLLDSTIPKSRRRLVLGAVLPPLRIKVASSFKIST
jgi:hypothetical protein